MADDQNIEEGSAEPQAGAEAPSAEPAAASETPVPLAESPALQWLGFVFIALAAVGVFSYGAETPSPGILALGLLGWGVVDLIGQGKGLGNWGGSGTAGSKLLNLARAIFLLGMGALLMLQAFGVMNVFGSNTLLIAGASFLAGYLLGAYALELATQSRDSFTHALLLGAFGVEFLSFFCFAVIFSVPWAAVFGAASLAMAGWAIYRGVLKSAPSLAPNVALVTLLLAMPFGYFLVREVINKELQPVHQATIFDPRFRELKGGVSREASDLAWSPGHTQPGQPGDIPYSDKIAFMDRRAGRDYLTVYASHDEGGALTERPMAPVHGRQWWSPDSDLLAVSEVSEASKKRVLLALQLDSAVFEKGGERLFHFKSMTISAQNVVPQDTHGQIFSPDGKNLYYASPQSKPKSGNTQLWAGRLADKKTQALTEPPFKTYPAASPDSTKVAFVGFRENVRYIEIGDGQEGKNPRLFNYKVESRLFPAWNSAQTQVLFTNPELSFLKIMSANNKADASEFSRDLLHSRLWKTEKGEFFTLEKKETGDLWQVYTMNPGGGGHKLVYESNASEILPPMWSADSKRIAFIERIDKRYSIYTVGRDGEWPRRVFVTQDPIRDLGWCPDSQRLAWFCDRHEGRRQELWVADKKSLNPEMDYESDGELKSLSWSPEGEHIAFEEKWAFKIGGLRLVRPDLYSTQVVDVTQHRVRSLTAGGLFARMPSFSPRGIGLAFLVERRSFAGVPGNWSLLPAPRRPATLAVAKLF